MSNNTGKLNLITGIITALTALVVWFIATTPNVTVINRCLHTSLYHVWLCDRNPDYVPLRQISPIFRAIVVESEDGNFYRHHGFDWSQIHDSFDKDLESHRIVRGGSTITQQLAKNVFLTKDRTIIRKLREAYITVQLEAMLTKSKILEKYLNVIELGPGIYGVKAAARHYFNKSPADLNVLEAAYLAYLIPNPRVYSRTFERKTLTPFAKFRMTELMDDMDRMGKISDAEYALAKNDLDLFPWQNVSLTPAPAPATAAAPPAPGVVPQAAQAAQTPTAAAPPIAVAPQSMPQPMPQSTTLPTPQATSPSTPSGAKSVR